MENGHYQFLPIRLLVQEVSNLDQHPQLAFLPLEKGLHLGRQACRGFALQKKSPLGLSLIGLPDEDKPDDQERNHSQAKKGQCQASSNTVHPFRLQTRSYRTMILACRNIVSGIERPIASAAFRLMAKKNSTISAGKSAGLAPLNI